MAWHFRAIQHTANGNLSATQVKKGLMWQEESLFYIGQDIGDYFGDNQRGFGLVQRDVSRGKCQEGCNN